MQSDNNLIDNPINRLAQIYLSDEDVPIIRQEISVARYPLPSLESDLADIINNAEIADTDYITSQFINKLQQYLSGTS